MAYPLVARASHSELPAHTGSSSSNSSFITSDAVESCGSISLRFARVEGSSLEEKMSFLAEQRERELNRCEAFAREVEEAMEREISARFGRNRCGYHSAASPASSHPISPRYADASCPTSLPSPSQPCVGRPSRFHRDSVKPAHVHLRHVSADRIPDLQQGQQPAERMAMGNLGPAERQHTQPASGIMPASPSWFADLSYYGTVSPSGAHTGRNNRGRQPRRDAAGNFKLRTAGRFSNEEAWKAAEEASKRRTQSM